MKRMSSWKSVSIVLVVAMAAILTAPMAFAAPIPSQAVEGTSETPAPCVEAGRAVVESALVEFGLSEEAAASRVELLTDQEVSVLASDLTALQTAGQSIRWNTTTVLLLVLLVILLVD